MKKLVLSVFLCLLVLCLTLPCFASFKLSETYFFAENYQEYKKGLRERKQKMPSNFISYDRVSFLGEFRGFRCKDLERNAYVYFLRSPEGQDLTVAFNTSPESTPFTAPLRRLDLAILASGFTTPVGLMSLAGSSWVRPRPLPADLALPTIGSTRPIGLVSPVGFVSPIG